MERLLMPEGDCTNLVSYKLTLACRVIAKLHSLAMDPRNRSVIARDTGCLQNIIRMLDFPADDVTACCLHELC
eukprot:727249-Hanusia_phi.AAC.6